MKKENGVNLLVEKAFNENTLDGICAYVNLQIPYDNLPKKYLILGNYLSDESCSFSGIILDTTKLVFSQYDYNFETFTNLKLIVPCKHTKLVFENFEKWRKSLGINSVTIIISQNKSES